MDAGGSDGGRTAGGWARAGDTGAGGGAGTKSAPVGGTLGGGGGGSSYIGGPGVSNASTLSGSNGIFDLGGLPANTTDPAYQSGIGKVEFVVAAIDENAPGANGKKLADSAGIRMLPIRLGVWLPSALP